MYKEAAFKSYSTFRVRVVASLTRDWVVLKEKLNRYDMQTVVELLVHSPSDDSCNISDNTDVENLHNLQLDMGNRKILHVYNNIYNIAKCYKLQ